jgi:3-deoxy-D-arabino-heptulosonate 7-phosphate (DAHP) synthase|tara:strand:+ start:642 stop:797 length:156 start_codon:yes stop_codon:yes gene_type:complete
MNSEHLPSAVGITGLLGTITLSDINNMVAIAVGATTLFYLGVKIFKELKKE